MRYACTVVYGIPGLPVSSEMGVCCAVAHMLGKGAIPSGLAPCRLMAWLGRVGVPRHLRLTGPRGIAGCGPLPGGHARGRSLRSRPMSADGLVRSCRRAAPVEVADTMGYGDHVRF